MTSTTATIATSSTATVAVLPPAAMEMPPGAGLTFIIALIVGLVGLVAMRRRAK